MIASYFENRGGFIEGRRGWGGEGGGAHVLRGKKAVFCEDGSTIPAPAAVAGWMDSTARWMYVLVLLLETATSALLYRTPSVGLSALWFREQSPNEKSRRAEEQRCQVPQWPF